MFRFLENSGLKETLHKVQAEASRLSSSAKEKVSTIDSSQVEQ